MNSEVGDMIECDVLVVGAGPASAARAAAMGGAKTILIEKKEEVGVPVQCGEAIGGYLLPYLPFKIPKEHLIWKIDGVSLWREGMSIERTGGQWSGYSIDRNKFDKWLAKRAVDSGVKLLTGTELVNIETDDNYTITKAVIKMNERKKEIEPKTVIAADGVKSSVLNLLGLYNPQKGTFAEVHSYEMDNLDLIKPHLEQIFVGDFTPSGYAYIFPKSKKTANIGVGGLFPKKKLESYFNEFLDIAPVKKQIKNARYITEKSGNAPFNYITDKWTYGNVLLTGDTAAQNFKPFIEGILPGIICGNISGKVATDIDHLQEYTTKIKEVLGPLFVESDKIRDLMLESFSLNGNKKYLFAFGIASDIFSINDVKRLRNLDENKIIDEIRKVIS